MDETDFYEKKMIYKRKKLILEEIGGLQLPDEVNIFAEERKERKKRKKEKQRKEREMKSSF